MEASTQIARPYTFCIDVGGHQNIGWADSDDGMGNHLGLAEKMQSIGDRLSRGEAVALGFEAPVWTPARETLEKLTSRRGGFETLVNRPWSAAAGANVTATNLALMPWCFREIAKQCQKKGRSICATVRLDHFRSKKCPLLIWEAFVTGAGQANNHANDAKLACCAFLQRWPYVESDIPREPCINHAVSAALASGISIGLDELTFASLVIGVQH